MGTDATAADDDDEGIAQLLQALVAEEDAVACELLEDQFVVEVASLGALGEGGVANVFLVERFEEAGAGELVGVSSQLCMGGDGGE